MTDTGRILVVGQPGVDVELLLALIRGQLGPAAARSSRTWRLDTKYYTADVQLDVQTLGQCDQLDLGAAGYEAVLLVFNSAQHSSFMEVQRWYEAAGGGDADLGVKLAVSVTCGSGGSGGSAQPGWLAAAEEWCAEQLVEYVDAGAVCLDGSAAAAAAAAAANGTPSSVGREGASGVQRIREALEAHLWPGLQLKPSPRAGSGGGGGSDAAAAAAGQADAADAVDVEDAVPAASGAASPGSSSDSGGGGGSSAQPAAAAPAPGSFSFAEYLQATDSSGAAAGAVGGAAGGAAAAAGGHGQGEEGEMEQLEQLFAQLTSHQARLAQLPDGERREAAAAMVMQLMAAMGMEGEEEGEEEEEGDVVSGSDDDGQGEAARAGQQQQ